MTGVMKKPEAPPRRGTILRGATVFDGLGNGPVIKGDVVILDGRIIYCGTQTDHALGDDAEVLDVTACTVMPGLIDTHVHLFDEGHTSPLDPVGAYERGVARMQAALKAGVTTIRDLGSPFLHVFDLKDAVRRGALPGPRILAAGTAICAVNGHCHGTLAIEAKGPAQVRALVCEQLDRGADLIKVMATSGAGMADEPEQPTQLDASEMLMAVETAHSAGRPVLSHAHSSVGIRDSLKAGVDGIEHGVFLTVELVDTMLQRNVTLSPTLSVYKRLAELDSDRPGPQRARRILAPHANSVRRAARAGVRIILGSDAGSDFHPLGDVALELEMLVDCGLSPIEAIHAATGAAAKACGIADEVGTLEAGKRADVLVVRGDASERIGAVADVRIVMRDGRIVVTDGVLVT
jgi:imidazolonepropionase-like amidohydrolase